MPDRRTTHATASFVGTLFVALFAIFGLVSCGGGGAASGNNAAASGAGAAPAAPVIDSLIASYNGAPITQPIPYNAKPTIAWASTNASRCFLDVPNTPISVTGTWQPTVGLTADTTYTLSCENSVGAKTMQAVTVTVSPQPVMVLISATPTTISSGQTSIINWSSANSTSCVVTGTASTASSGTFITLPLTVDTTYTATCSNSLSGLTANQSVTVTVTSASAPTINFTVPASPLSYNTSATISWTASNATSCTLAGLGAPGSSFGANASWITPNLTADTPYTLTCDNGTASASSTRMVNVSPPPVAPTISFSANPNPVVSGNLTTLTWASNAASCALTLTSSPPGAVASTNGSGTAPNGSFPITLTAVGTYIFTVTCTGSGGITSSRDVSVIVNAPGVACPTIVISGAAGAITLPDVAALAPSATPATAATPTTPAIPAIRGGLTGVAPLSVFFDATGTSATAAPTPSEAFHKLEYYWDFGDAVSGIQNLSPPVTGSSTWDTGSRPTGTSRPSSRNKATGSVAAHVYETPGTYTVTLEVTDGTNKVSYQNSCAPKIVVQDPNLVFSGANTICIGATAIPTATDCPGDDAAEIRVMQSDFAAAVNTYAKAGKRVLFKRGDTFNTNSVIPSNTDTVAQIYAAGPGIVGAFGTGNRPIVRATGTSTVYIFPTGWITAQGNIMLGLSHRTTPGISDWRVMDIEFDGMSKEGSGGISFSGGMSQVTLLRLSIHDIYNTGVGNSTNLLDGYNISPNTSIRGHKMWDQIAIVDSSVLRNLGYGTGNGGSGMYLATRRFSLLGTTVDDITQAEHVLRFPYLGKAVLSNNTLSRQAANKAVIKLHAPTWDWPAGCPDPGVSTCAAATPPSGVMYDPGNGATGYTEQVIISDNKIVNGDTASWAVVAGPANVANDQRVRDVIAERNLFVAGAGTQSQAAFVVQDSATEITARNNICTGWGTCFWVWKDSPSARGFPPYNIRIYNNTAYSATSLFQFLWFSNTGKISLQNNLAYAPLASNTTMAPGFPTFCIGCPLSNNSSDSQIKSSNPLFAVMPPLAPADYTPASAPVASYAIGSASAVPPVPVWSDFFGNSRPASGVPGIDMGAIEAVP